MENRTEIVLIGSYALREYGFDAKSDPLEGLKDIDIVVAKEDAFDLIRTIPCVKEGQRFFYIHVTEVKRKFYPVQKIKTKILLDIAIPKPCSALSALRDWCLKHQSELKEIDPFEEPIPGIKVILPPLELLYALKKGHIHRIIPCTPSQEQNIEVWHRQINMYTWMREKLGYKRMDTILYGEDRYGDPIGPSKDSLDLEVSVEHLEASVEHLEASVEHLEDTMRMVFLRNFDETNTRVGDTPTDLEKTEEEFFEDNVERYVEHDELHRRVAMIYRAVEEELFSKYQEPGSVNLVKELYFKYPLSEHIQCYVEEISVLLAERKMIPTLVKCYKEADVPFTRFDSKKIKEDLREIIAHFGTNLCGKGHYWLRRYFLDHYSLISKTENFDLQGLEMLSVEIVDFQDFEKDEKTVDLREMMEERMSNKTPSLVLESFKDRFGMTPFDYSNNFSEDSKVLNIKAYAFDAYEVDGLDIDEIELYADHVPDPILKLIYRIKDSTLFYCGRIRHNDYALFDLDHQIGFHRKGEEWYIFFLSFNYDANKVRIVGSVYRLSGEKMDDIDENYKLKVNCYYYESSDTSCGWANEHEGPELLFVSNYGVNPIKCLDNLLEKVSRVRLNQEHDKEPPKRPRHDPESYYFVGHTRDV